MLIMTDGEENSSREYSLQTLRAAIQQKEQEGGWTFTYMGANPDDWKDRVGLPCGNGFRLGEVDSVRTCFSTMSRHTTRFRHAAPDNCSDFYTDVPTESSKNEVDEAE